MWRRQRCLGGCVQLPGDVWRDNIRNTKIRVTVKVAEVSKKVQKKTSKGLAMSKEVQGEGKWEILKLVAKEQEGGQRKVV